MLRTKLAKKVLTKKEQKHLTESNIHSMAGMQRQANDMRDKPVMHVCWECKCIAKKLELL
jgi:hypothetical protein